VQNSSEDKDVPLFSVPDHTSNKLDCTALPLAAGRQLFGSSPELAAKQRNGVFLPF